MQDSLLRILGGRFFFHGRVFSVARLRLDWIRIVGKLREKIKIHAGRKGERAREDRLIFDGTSLASLEPSFRSEKSRVPTVSNFLGER